MLDFLYVVANLTVKALVCPNRSAGTAVVTSLDGMLRQKMDARCYDALQGKDIIRKGITYKELFSYFGLVLNRTPCNVATFRQ